MNLPILPTLHTLPILPIFHTLHRYIDTEGCFRPDRLKQIAARYVYIYIYVYCDGSYITLHSDCSTVRLYLCLCLLWLVARLHYRLKHPQSMFQGVQCAYSRVLVLILVLVLVLVPVLVLVRKTEVCV